MFFSPLEQFDIIYFGVFSVYFFVFDFINIYFFLLIVFFFFFYLIFLRRSNFILPGNVQYVFEFLYRFFLDLLIQQAGNSAKKYFPMFFYVFLVIVLSNLFGMLPYSFTITAHLCITFFLSFSFNLFFIFVGFYKNGFGFLELFIPKGAPIYLMPLIVVIELVSYLIRTFSLSIRLFANMMAGHCLLFVISTFVYSIINIFGIFSIIILFFIYLGVFILEFAICLLQAYVFTILLCIYLNDSLHPGH